ACSGLYCACCLRCAVLRTPGPAQAAAANSGAAMHVSSEDHISRSGGASVESSDAVEVDDKVPRRLGTLALRAPLKLLRTKPLSALLELKGHPVRVYSFNGQAPHRHAAFTPIYVSRRCCIHAHLRF